MGKPISLFGQARAFARDFPRDQMPAGYLWDIIDFVPSLVDARLTGRGGWKWGSDAFSAYEAQHGILATFTSGDRLLVAASVDIATHGRFYEVNQTTGAVTDFAPAAPSLQNMLQLGEEVISMGEDGYAGPQVITVGPGGTLSAAEAYTGEDIPVRRGCVYRSMFVSAAARPPVADEIELRTVRFSVPGEPLLHANWGRNQEGHVIAAVGTAGAGGTGLTLNTPLTGAHAAGASVFVIADVRSTLAAPAAIGATSIKVASIAGFAVGQNVVVDDPRNIDSFEPNSFIITSKEVTGLAALRTMILVFHKGSTERIRGSTPPTTVPDVLPADALESDFTGDMWLEPMFENVGCYEPKTIAYWNDNVLFANEQGVFATDGSTLTNLVSQGGIRSYWRQMYIDRKTLSGAVFLDYYIATITRNDGSYSTLVCDIPRRQWFRFNNVPATAFIASSSTANMERLWAGLKGTHRLARLGPCFFPDLDIAPLSDDDGTPVLPSFETPWYRLSDEGRKRVRFAYLSYDARLPALTPVLDLGYITSPQQSTYTDAGQLPSTDEYTRYRLPIGKFPYGVAFRVAQTQATSALRIYDLGIEAQVAERSRV